MGNVEDDEKTDDVKRLHIVTENGDTAHGLRQHGQNKQHDSEEKDERGDDAQFSVVHLINQKHTDIAEQQVLQMLQHHFAAHTIDHNDGHGGKEDHKDQNHLVGLQVDAPQ